MITNQKFGGIGEASKFELQYVPAHGKSTQLGTAPVASKKKQPSKAYALVAIAAGLMLAALGLLQVVKHSEFVPQYIVSSLIVKGQALQGLT